MSKLKSNLFIFCRLNDELGWGMNIIDSTDIFVAVLRGEDHMPLYNEVVLKPSMDIMQGFLGGEAQDRDMMSKWRTSSKLCFIV